MITGDSPRFCLEDRLSKYLEGLTDSAMFLGWFLLMCVSIRGILDDPLVDESLVGLGEVDLSLLKKALF